MQLTSSNFENKGGKIKLKNQGVGLLFIGVNWCGHCVAFKPIFQQFSEITKGQFNTYTADGDSLPKNLLKKLGVVGFPSLFLVSANGALTKYQGNRTLFDLTKLFCQYKSNSSICKIN